MKRCSPSYVIRELQVRTAMLCYYLSIRVAKIQNNDNIKCWRVCEQEKLLLIVGMHKVTDTLGSLKFLTK